MPFAQLHDGFSRHRRMRQACKLGGPLAMSLWVCGLEYCSEQLTDGFIPEDEVQRLTTWKVPSKVLSALTAPLPDGTPGLWEAVDGGFQVHNFCKRNRSREQVDAEREAARKRMQAARDKRARSGEQEPNEEECSPELRPNFARTSPERIDERSPTRQGKAREGKGRQGRESGSDARDPRTTEPEPEPAPYPTPLDAVLPSHETAAQHAAIREAIRPFVPARAVEPSEDFDLGPGGVVPTPDHEKRIILRHAEVTCITQSVPQADPLRERMRYHLRKDGLEACLLAVAAARHPRRRKGNFTTLGSIFGTGDRFAESLSLVKLGIEERAPWLPLDMRAAPKPPPPCHMCDCPRHETMTCREAMALRDGNHAPV